MQTKIFYSHYTCYTNFFSFFIIFFRDRQRSNATSGSNIASSGFLEKENEKNFFWLLFVFSAENKMH